MAVGIWIGLWIATIVISFLLFKAAGPPIPGVDAKTENLRKGILGVGFLPCFGINAISALMIFSQYKVKTRGVARSHDAINERFNQSGGLSTPPSSGPSSTNRPSSDNPFL